MVEGVEVIWAGVPVPPNSHTLAQSHGMCDLQQLTISQLVKRLQDPLLLWDYITSHRDLQESHKHLQQELAQLQQQLAQLQQQHVQLQDAHAQLQLEHAQLQYAKDCAEEWDIL
jgi:uncharacterized protein YlxW (UPF0749 family)